jgi:hypothetical protein
MIIQRLQAPDTGNIIPVPYGTYLKLDCRSGYKLEEKKNEKKIISIFSFNFSISHIRR